MSQTTYEPRGLDPDADFSPGPERTSILAILALVLSLLCFIPFMGVLAAVLGFASLIGISRSSGRVGGSGMAIAGLVIGLLFTAIWGGIFYGAAQVSQFFKGQIVGPASQAIKAIDQGDFQTGRDIFVPAAAAQITDEQLKAFRDGYQADIGAYQGVPQSFVDIIKGYAELGPLMQKYQGNNPATSNVFPLPAFFDKESALVVFYLETPTKPAPGAVTVQVGTGNKNNLPVKGIEIVTRAGKSYIVGLVPTVLPAPAGAPPALPGSGGASDPAGKPPAQNPDEKPAEQAPDGQK